jgi:hypothetical protein
MRPVKANGRAASIGIIGTRCCAAARLSQGEMGYAIRARLRVAVIYAGKVIYEASVIG